MSCYINNTWASCNNGINFNTNSCFCYFNFGFCVVSFCILDLISLWRVIRNVCLVAKVKLICLISSTISFLLFTSTLRSFKAFSLSDAVSLWVDWEIAKSLFSFKNCTFFSSLSLLKLLEAVCPNSTLSPPRYIFP